MIYYFFFFSLLLTILLGKKKLSVLIYILFSGLRYKIGNDWLNYIGLIEGIQNIASVGNMGAFSQEPIFKYLVFLITLFPFSAEILYQIIIFLSVTLNGILIYSIISKYSYKFISFYLFIGFSLFREFDVLRQSLALLLIHYSFYLKTPKNNLLNLITASLFHYTSGLFIIFNQLRQIFSPQIILLIFGLIQVLNFNILAPITSLNIPKLQFYLFEITGEMSYITFNEFIATITFIIFTLKRLKIGLFPIENIAFRFLGLQLILLAVFNGYTEIQDRLSFYFYFSEAIAITALLGYFSKKSIPIIIFMIALIPMLKTWRVLRIEENKLSYLPYRNILFKSDIDDSDAEFNWFKKHRK